MASKLARVGRRPIQILPEHLIDQIKAGEVIERPASLIKELLENSLDAGAQNIKIHLVDAGMELIQIEDDGTGMSFADLPYAFCRHATSKIERFEDIYNLYSYGFRGEALASLSSIARVTCVTSPVEDPTSGGRLVLHGGKTISHTPHSSDQSGTSFFIKDLFYNTPARLKFIKSKTTEKNSLKRILNSFLLCSPKVNFTLRWDDDEKIFFPATTSDDSKDRIAQVLLKKPIPEQLHFVDEIYEDHRIVAYLSKESSRGSAHKQQYLFVNDRLFFDKSLHQLVMRSMEGIWGIGESGHYAIFIKAPPSQIDVNVHPHKTHVKFFKSSLIYSILSGMLKKLKSKPHITKTSNQNLFSHENYQELELKEMLRTSESSEDHLGNTEDEHIFTEPQPSQANSIVLEKNFFIHQHENKYYLVSYQRYLGHLLKDEILKTDTIPEHETTPLLISEPFKILNGPIDAFLSFLKNYGFEIDRLDHHTLALRAIPRVIESLNYRLLVGELCLFLNQDHKTSPKETLAIFFEKKIPLEGITQNTLEFLISSFNTKNQGCKEIDRDFLEKAFL